MATTDTTRATRREAVAALVKAMNHPLRIAILEALVARSADEFEGETQGPDGTLSPSEIAAHLDVPLPNLSYHMRMLVERGAVKLKRTKPRRGAIEHYYAATMLARKVLQLFDAVERP